MKKSGHKERRYKFELLEEKRVLTGFTNVIDQLGDHRPGGFSGAAWFDYNNDGLDDLFSNGLEIGKAALYRNESDGSFTNVAEEAGIADFAGHAGVNAGDIDNDGFTDLILVGRDQALFAKDAPAVKVLKNMGDGTFADVTESSGITSPETPGAAAFADVDRDGDIDFFITATGNLPSNQSHANRFFLNNGDFTFTEATEEVGLAGSGPWSCVASFSDYDNDADSDLIIANCNEPGPSRTPMQLFQNDGKGNFTDVSRDANMRAEGFWMGFAFADYDNDGDVDFHVTNAGTSPGSNPHALHENEGDGTFRNRASTAGVANGKFGWGNSSADFNNDGLADLLYIGTLSQKQVNIGAEFTCGNGNSGTLHLNTQGDLSARHSFVDASSELGIDQSCTFSAGLATSDFDNNGTVDVFLPALSLTGSDHDLTETESRSVLLQNTMAEGKSWLGVSLTGTISNRDAIGARIMVKAGDLVQTREIYGGSSFLSTNSFSQRFGLDDYEGTPEIKVRWPNGLQETFVVENSLNSVVSVVEGEGVQLELPDRIPGDATEDGVVNFSDFLVVSANFGESGTVWGTGDFNGDGETGFPDFLILSENFGETRPTGSQMTEPLRLGTPVNLGAATNSSDWEFGLDFSDDGNTMYFNRCNFETGACDLYTTSRPDSESPWETATAIESVNTSATEVGPSITADGLELYFSDEVGPPNVIRNLRPESQNGDIWVAKRTSTAEDWGTAELISSLNTNEVETYPKVSADGLTIHFSRGNNSETHVATRNSRDEPFGTATTVGAPISVPSGGASGIEFSPDALAAFWVSYRDGGLGESDIWMATRDSADDDWKEPVNMGEIVNDSGFNGFPNLSKDGNTLYYVSTRSGGRGGLDIWSLDVI